MKGKVVAAVRIKEMPAGILWNTYPDLIDPKRWPYGVPCEVIYSPAVAECPELRQIILEASPDIVFGDYTTRLHGKPLRLEPALAKRLNEVFAKFRRIR